MSTLTQAKPKPKGAASKGKNAASNGKSAERRGGVGGRRLAEAFDIVTAMPALAEARRRLLGMCEQEVPSPGDVSEAIEADTAIAVAIMRAANNGGGPSGRTGGVREAVEYLQADGVAALANKLDTYDILDQPGTSSRHERFRRHSVAVRIGAERIGEVARLPQRDELAVAALLHDVGKLVLSELYGHDQAFQKPGESPDEHARRERRELGIDHALVGAVLVRRWGLPSLVATAVERHHSGEATGHAAAIRLADLVVHHAAGDPVSAEAMRGAATSLDIDENGLNSLLFEFPHLGEPRRRSSEPCPLSARELDALRGLGEGMVYKQIAQELTLSVSTVRTHLHNVYRKIGAVDRAQAVLIARERGWL
jgi:putative nucleotidyltransferase with HDIG domain